MGSRIRNTENVKNKGEDISLRCPEQLKPNVVWGVLRKIIQNNAWFGLSDRLEVHLGHVMLPAGNGRVKTKGCSLDVISAIKKSTVVVKAALNCWLMY